MNACNTCRAYKIDDSESVGSCQLHPPVVVGEGFMFPGVHPLAWCLDWQASEGSPLTSNAAISYHRELTRANLLQEQLDAARKLTQRAPTETETVCSACDGHGWVERGY